MCFFDLKVPYHEKHVFYGVYICKLVLPEPTNSTNEESKQVLHHLCSPPTGKTALWWAVKIQRLLLRDDRKAFIDWPPLCENTPPPLPGDIREGGIHPRGKVWFVQQQDSSVSQCHRSDLDTQIALLLVVKINLSAYILSQLQKRQWLRFIFNDIMPATVCVSLFVCANYFTSDSFSNECQYKAGFATTLTLLKRISPTHTGPSNCTWATDMCRHVLIVFPVAKEL